MKYSILHISDLHRVKADTIDCIMSSFEVEKSRFEEMGFAPVQLIVVSGDIVDGSKEKDAFAAKQQIQKQYETASSFLNQLCDLFIGSEHQDRQRVIIVPGNHDVSHYMSEQSMEQINHDEKGIGELLDAFWTNETDIRWSWKSLHFNRITDQVSYNRRFDDFINFYDSFYNGIREFPKDPDRQSFLVDIPDLNISFACFNSCYRLDHLRLSGYISPRSLSSLTKPLLEAKNNGRLLVGVWHHHTRGLPNESNYLDYSILDNMVQNGIQLALHGHQHISGIINEYKDVFMESRLNLISAGTLYGNAVDLPAGKARQYNLLEVEMDNENCNIILHSREDNTALNVMPAWGEGTIGRTRKTIYEVSIALPPRQMLNEELKVQNTINEINIFIEKTGNVEEGLRMFQELGMDKDVVRKFVLDILLRLNDYAKIINLFIEPKNNKEAISVIEGCIKTKNKEAFGEILKSSWISSSTDSSIISLIKEAKFFFR